MKNHFMVPDTSYEAGFVKRFLIISFVDAASRRSSLWMTMCPASYPRSRLEGRPHSTGYEGDSHSFHRAQSTKGSPGSRQSHQHPSCFIL